MQFNDLLGPFHTLRLIPSRGPVLLIASPVLLRGRDQRLHVAFFVRRDFQLLDERLVLVLVQTLAPAVLTGHMLLDAPVEGAEGAPGPVAILDEGLTLTGQGNGFILEIVRVHLAGLRQYLQLDKLREAMFFVAGELFNFQFSPVPDGSVPVFHEDVRVWEVTGRDSGNHIGLWYLDPYARPGKESGAWATTYRRHETFDGKKTVLAANNSNFIEAPPGEPILISWDDARTLFHEFGHALHYFSSHVAYPTLNGALRDYVEFQSQLLERWLLTDAVIEGYLIHHETGEPIPSELVARIRNAATFNQGFATTEYLASALVDMRYHTIDPAGIDPDAFEPEVLAELNMPGEIVMRHRSPHFGHVFSGEGYAAGYYGYLWADVLTADAAEAFAGAPGGFYDKELAGKLLENLFAPQNSVDPVEAYRAFRGRDARVDALMRDRGFPVD